MVIINAEGKKLETELLYWDMKKELIYSDRYVKLSADGQIIEGNNGFHSDQNLNHPVFENISGSIEVEKQQRNNDSNPFGDIDLSSVICILFGNGDRFPDF